MPLEGDEYRRLDSQERNMHSPDVGEKQHRRTQSEEVQQKVESERERLIAEETPKYATYTASTLPYRKSSTNSVSSNIQMSWQKRDLEARGKVPFELHERNSTVNSVASVGSTGSSAASTVHTPNRSLHKQELKTEPRAHTFTYVNKKKKIDWDDLVNIQIHKKHGLIDEVEYRKSQAELGGTVITTGAKPRRSLAKKNITDKKVLFGGMTFIKEQPNWSEVPAEKVMKYSYNPDSEEWEKEEQMVQLAPNPFAYGSQRMCFYLRNVDKDPKDESTCVAKIISPIIEERDAYFKDVAMQTHAQVFADLFNKYGVVKGVAFLDCWIIEFVERHNLEHYEPVGPQLMAVEKQLEGEYRKYNNNMEWVENILRRNTPQAFSHYTYETSNEEILICDIQGVNDIYTDPQFHTKLGMDDPRFGSGNLGQIGVDGFFRKHQCNSICAFLKLKRRNKTVPDLLKGTKTNTRFMERDSVVTYNVPESSHLKSIPQPGGKKTYDATLSSLGNRSNSQHHGAVPPLLPPLKKKRPEKQKRFCCW